MVGSPTALLGPAPSTRTVWASIIYRVPRREVIRNRRSFIAACPAPGCGSGPSCSSTMARSRLSTSRLLKKVFRALPWAISIHKWPARRTFESNWKALGFHSFAARRRPRLFQQPVSGQMALSTSCHSPHPSHALELGSDAALTFEIVVLSGLSFHYR